MADDEKILATALKAIFKNPKIPPELFERRQCVIQVDEAECKINITLKRGLVVSIEEDSAFWPFLKPNDIVLTINDKVVGKVNFKLQDIFKDTATKSLDVTYIRMKWTTDDQPAVEDAERRDGYEYRVIALFNYPRIPLGLALQAFRHNKTIVMDVVSKSLCRGRLLVGDRIMGIGSTSVGSNAAKTLEMLATEVDQKGYALVSIERPASEALKAGVAACVQAFNSRLRDPPVPADCAEYAKEAMRALRKAPVQKSIMKEKGSGETDSSVGFADRLHAVTEIPSDVSESLLKQTPDRVLGLLADAEEHYKQPARLPPPSKSEKKEHCSEEKTRSTPITPSTKTLFSSHLSEAVQVAFAHEIASGVDEEAAARLEARVVALVQEAETEWTSKLAKKEREFEATLAKVELALAAAKEEGAARAQQAKADVEALQATCSAMTAALASGFPGTGSSRSPSSASSSIPTAESLKLEIEALQNENSMLRSQVASLVEAIPLMRQI